LAVKSGAAMPAPKPSTFPIAHSQGEKAPQHFGFVDKRLAKLIDPQGLSEQENE
jgi:hypothetical protein